MPSGGHSRSGPPPDPNALRRDRPNDKAEWTRLPDKREGDPPAWPLTPPSPRERVLWTREWARPQAVIWEARGQQDAVALYVRALSDAERRGAPVNARTLVRQLMEELGISLPGLLRHRWIIDGQPAQAPVRTDAPDRASAKARLRVLQDTDTGAA